MQRAAQIEDDDIPFGIELPEREETPPPVKSELSTAGHLLASGATLADVIGFSGATVYGAISSVTPALSALFLPTMVAVTMKAASGVTPFFTKKGATAHDRAFDLSNLSGAAYGLLSLAGLEIGGGAITQPEQLVQSFATACVGGGITLYALRSTPLRNLFTKSAEPGSNEASAAPKPAGP